MKLEYFCKDHPGGLYPPNIDIIFNEIIIAGANELDLNIKEMKVIIDYIVANSGQTEYGGKALENGKVEQFMGIKLNLI